MNKLPHPHRHLQLGRCDGYARRHGAAVRFETLESRVLFSADLPVSVDVDAQAAVHAFVDAQPPAASPIIDLSALHRLTDQGQAPALPISSSIESPRELVAIDARVPEAARLYDLLFGGADSSGKYELLVLAPEDDAFDALGRILPAADVTFDAVHLIGHGSGGAMQLGANRLDGDSVLAHAEQLFQWRAYLADDADLLLYGCDVAAQPSGAAWLTLLAAITGADVAASDDLSGTGRLGGDWDLEFRVGTIEAISTPATLLDDIWLHTLGASETTTGDQGSPSVAVGANGGVVAVWQSATQDGSGWGVYGRLYDAAGAPMGGEFLVAQTTVGDQYSPDVSMMTNGDFVVTWASLGQDGDGAGEGNIYARRFAADGTPQGNEFLVNATTVGHQREASIAVTQNGDFAVAWTSGGQDGSGDGIYARKFDHAGNALTAEFRVNTTTAGDQRAPDVAADVFQDFLFVWQSDGQDGSGWGVYRTYLAPNGNFEGGEKRVNTVTAGDQYDPAVAFDGAGNWLIVWTSDGQDGSGLGVYADRFRYTGNGGIATGEFRVNQTTAGDQFAPTLAGSTGGDYVVAWTSLGQDGDAPTDGNVYLQLLERSGNSLSFFGAESIVNGHAPGTQYAPVVSMSTAGDYVATWSGAGPDDASGVFLQAVARPFGNAAPTVDLAASSLGYTENAGAVAFDPTLALADDGNVIQGAQIWIQAGFVAGQDVLAFTAQFGITGTYDAMTGVLALSGNATRANYQTVLRTVTYENTSDAPSDASRRIAVTVSDGSSTGTDTRDIVLQAVNDAPVLTGANGLVSIFEDAASNGGTLVSALLDGWTNDPDGAVAGGIAVIGTDDANGSWQYSTTAGASWAAFGTPSAASARLLAANGSTYVRFVPNANWHGTVAGGLTFRAWDQTSGTAGGLADTTSNGGATPFSSASAAAGIVVSAVNDAPTGTDAVVILNEDGAYAFSAADFGFADASDTPADTLDGVRIASLPAAGALKNNGVAVSVGQSVSRADIDAGRLVYTAGANANGSAYASFGFQVRDGGGTASGGVDLDPVSNTLVFDVSAVNDRPVNIVPPAQYTAFDTPLAFGAASSNAIWISDIDAGSSPIEVVVVAGNGAFSLGGIGGLVFTLGDGANDTTMVFRGTLAAIAAAFEGAVFTPTTGYSGTATLVLGAYDLGSTGAGGALTDDDTILIHVAAADALVATHDHYTAGEDTLLLGASVLGNDSDPLLGTLSVGAIDGNAAAIGVPVALASGALITMNADGTFVYDPNGAFDAVASGATSQDTFVYSLSSTSGRTGTGSVTITIDGMNDAPVLTGLNGLLPVVEDATNDTGTLVSTLIAGHVTDVDGGGVAGIAVIRVDDTHGSWQYTLDGGASWLAFGSPSAASARLLRADASTAVRFVPAANWHGTVTGGLVLRAWDASDALPNGTVGSTTLNGGRHAYSGTSEAANLTVVAKNDSPDGADRTLVLLEDGAVTLSAADFGFIDAADVPGDALLAVQIVTSPAHGSLRLNGITVSAGQFVSRTDIDAGRLQFTPATNAHGAIYSSFGFRVRDDGGTTEGGIDLDPVTNTITFDVTSVNDVPTLGSFPGIAPSGIEDVTTAFDFSTLLPLSDAVDADGTVTSFVVTAVSVGTLSIGTSQNTATPFAAGTNDIIDATRQAWWTPAANAWGTTIAAFTVRARDDAGAVSAGTATVHVDVAAVADRPQVSAATTAEDARTASGLVIQRNADDLGEVSHFRIDAITGGVLYLADGVTRIRDGDFITVAQGNAGLVFAPAVDSISNGSFLVYGATGASPAAAGTEAATAVVAVIPVNDAPVLTGIHDLPDIDLGDTGDAVLVSALLSGHVADVDGSSTFGLAVVGIDEAHGTWHYTLDHGTTWHVLVDASEGNALLLAGDPGVAIRFDPVSGYAGSAGISVRAWDRSSGVSGTRVDITSAGGDSAYSAAIATARVSVVPQPFVPSTSTVVASAVSHADVVQAAPGTPAAESAQASESKDDDAVPVPKDPPPSSGRAVPRVTGTQTQTAVERVDVAAPSGDRTAATIPGVEAAGTQAPVSAGASTPGVQQLGTPSLPVIGATRLVSPADFDRLGQDFVAQPEKSAQAMASRPLLDALDQVRESVVEEATIEARVAAASVAVTGSLSAGYVMWLVRGGVLATSLMSSLPAWRVLDPLPVLSHRARRDNDDDDESLESMVEDDSMNDPTEDEADTGVEGDLRTSTLEAASIR